jgi:peroxin-7
MVWDYAQTDNPLINRFTHHTEFVVGLDFNIFLEGQLASCSWDERVFVWNLGTVLYVDLF